MENMEQVMKRLFNSVYQGKRVLVTGHTGFKGSWLTYWLSKMGAIISGYSLEPPTVPNHFSLLDFNITSIINDINDYQSLMNAFNKVKPDIVFHLAAQPLVRLSYEKPQETFQTNIMGTVNVLEASRMTSSVKAMVTVTSDKCYENREWVWGYRENDPMGGHDPYSASKGCSEIVTESYRRSFSSKRTFTDDPQLLISSARAGNVIGGGDWAKDRIVADMMKAANEGVPFEIRNPDAVRPWQHVLEPLSGYLLLGQKLLEGHSEFASGWNFGPNEADSIKVIELTESMKKIWSKISPKINKNTANPHEANMLKLDCSKAHTVLKWNSVWDCEHSFIKTAEWYKAFYEKSSILTSLHLEQYIADASKKKICWVQ
jgi:CDP-glucose 4,6-dehydratase